MFTLSTPLRLPSASLFNKFWGRVENLRNNICHCDLTMHDLSTFVYFFLRLRLCNSLINYQLFWYLQFRNKSSPLCDIILYSSSFIRVPQIMSQLNVQAYIYVLVDWLSTKEPTNAEQMTCLKL